MSYNSGNRRKFFHSLAFGTLAVSAHALPFGKPATLPYTLATEEDELFYRYPAMSDSMVSEVVGASHGRFDRVRELVDARPELAKATWDWGFGDYESALGAAAHMGRRDIAEYLMSMGARPDIYTFAMLGKLEAVKAMIQAAPGIQRTLGPHGFTLLQHAKSRLWHKDVSEEEKEQANTMIAYLESLGDADISATSMEMSEEEKAIYVGDYRWGEKEDEVFFVKLNSRNYLQIGRTGTFGRALNKVGDHLFAPSGGASVRISFEVENNIVQAVTIHEPEPVVTAVRI